MFMQFPYKNIVVLTGAGISAESGIKTFRSKDGLWEDHHIEDVATPEGFVRNPQLVQSFYNRLRKNLQSGIFPNEGHNALARLERELDGNVTIITQNIDDLHEKAGSQHVLHMHGELLQVRCVHSNQVLPWTKDINPNDLCHCCQIPAVLRPHIVWFGEMPLYMEDIQRALMAADLFISIGTSGVVYPAAGFVHEALISGAKTVEINLEPSVLQSEFEEKRYGNASVLVPEFVDELLSMQ